MWQKTGYTAAVAVAMMFHQAASAQEQDNNPYRVATKISGGCSLLSNKNCHGSRQEIRVETPSGYSLSVERITDDAAATPFDKTYELGQVGNIHGNINWSKKVSGTIGRLGVRFNPTEKSALNIEVYAGKLTGEVGLNASADATLYPLSVTLPPRSYGGYTYPGGTYAHPGLRQELADYAYKTVGQSYYGGFRQSFGTGVSLNRNTHITINEFAQIGLDKIAYGAGLGIAYTSQPDDKIGMRASTICQRGDFYSTSQYAFIMAACADKVQRDLIYDKMYKKAGQIAAKADHLIVGAQSVADKIKDKTGYGHQFPTYTADSVMSALGFSSPYGHINTSIVVGAAANIGGATLTLAHTQPLNTRRDGKGTTSVSLGYHF